MYRPDEDLYRIEMPYFVCGFFVKNGTITETAPIIRWAAGKTLQILAMWASKKGGTIQKI